MVQNIHPLGINTRLFSPLVLRLIVRPSRLLVSLNGIEITMLSAFRCLVSLLELLFFANAKVKNKNNYIPKRCHGELHEPAEALIILFW